MKFYPVMAHWSEVPISLLVQDRSDIEAVVDGRGYVAFSRRVDPLDGIVEAIE